jgi:hypothetical protein
MSNLNLCPDGQVVDKTTKVCRPPLKRGRKTTAKKLSCLSGQVLDKKTKKCRLPLKRGRTAKNPNKSPNKSPNKNNTTLDKYGFSIPVFKPKIYKDEKQYKQTTMLAFSKSKRASKP